MGLFWPFYRLPGLAVGGFKSLPLYAVFIRWAFYFELF